MIAYKRPKLVFVIFILLLIDLRP